MNKKYTGLALIVFALALAIPAAAKFPWPSGANISGAIQNVTGSTPSPTAFPTASGVPGVIIDLMTGNTTMGSLSGGETGNSETLILEQDGTGGRTFTAPSNLKGMPSSIPTAANSWTVCNLYFDGTNFNVVPTGICSDNAPLTGVYANVQTSAGTAVGPNAHQQLTALSVPGASANTPCSATAQAFSATWQGTIGLQCVPSTNQVQVELENYTAATVTPSATAISIRLYP